MGLGRKIDEIDTKIIKGLLYNARKSFVELADECNISAVSIGDRFAELEKAGVITGSTIQVDHCALGVNATCGVIVKVDKEQTDSVIAFIRKIPFEVPLIVHGVRNDIYFLASLKDINDVSYIKEIMRKNNSVQNVRTEIWTGIRNIPENIELTNPTQSITAQIYSPIHHEVDVELDAVDFQIIDRLSKNSMQPFGNIAKEIGKSIKTVSRKYKRLFDCGVIKPTIQVDLPKLGYHAIVTFALTLGSQTDLESVMKEVMAINNIVLLIRTSGEFDLVIYVLLKDIDQLLVTQEQVGKIRDISQVEISVFPTWGSWPTVNEAISTF